MKIKEFLKVNHLRQKDLAAYLGIGEPAISKVVTYKGNLSEENIEKLLNNEQGWDTSMLLEPDTPTIYQNITATGSISGGVSQTSVPSVPGVSPELMESLMKQLEENRKMLVLLAEQLSNSNKLNEWLREQLDKRG